MLYYKVLKCSDSFRSHELHGRFCPKEIQGLAKKSNCVLVFESLMVIRLRTRPTEHNFNTIHSKFIKC